VFTARYELNPYIQFRLLSVCTIPVHKISGRTNSKSQATGWMAQSHLKAPFPESSLRTNTMSFVTLALYSRAVSICTIENNTKNSELYHSSHHSANNTDSSLSRGGIVFTVWYGLNTYILCSSIQASKGNALIRTMSRTPERRGLSERGARQVHCVLWPDFTSRSRGRKSDTLHCT
jgi:hypothetical protein